MRKRGSRDNKLQSGEEPGGEKTEKPGGSSRLRRYGHANLVSTKLNRQVTQAIRNTNNVLLIYIDSGNTISQTFSWMEILYVKIQQQSKQVFTSGSESVKLAPRSLFNWIVVAVYVLRISLSRILCFHCLSGYLYPL